MNFDSKSEEENIKTILEDALEVEEDLMRTYIITAEQIHKDGELKERLENFAQGNAKRTQQLMDELKER